MSRTPVSSALEQSNSDLPSIPVISITPLLTPTSLTLPTAQSLLSAFHTAGFFYLIDAPIPDALLADIFARSARFFARPQSQKDSLAWTTPEANRGYVRQGREKASQGMTQEEVAADRLEDGEDIKESFEIGRESTVPGEENRWPDKLDAEGAAFKSAMQDFFTRCQSIHVTILRGLALALGFPETYFDSFVSDANNNLRLLHYPPLPAGAFQNGKRVRAGLHSDFGSITLLFQDDRGGLQVERPGEPAGRYVDVVPKKGTIVVNSGDLLARWSNGLIRSTMHRVVEPPVSEPFTPTADGSSPTSAKPPGTEGYPARYSIAYFCNPNTDAWIEALPGTWEGEKGGKKFPGVWSGEYLVRRLSAIY